MSSKPSLLYEELPPPERWREFLECCWHAVDSVPRSDRPAEHIVPDGCPELIVHLGDPFSRRVGTGWRRQGRAFLASTLSRPWSLRAGRVVDTFGMRFRPGALPQLLAVDMRGTVDRELPLTRLLGFAAARRLRQRLASAPDLAARAAAATAWLAEAAGETQVPSATPCTRAVGLIRAGRGGVRVEAVAAELGRSRRQLERDFATGLGIGPKLYSRIVRLQAALVELDAAERGASLEAALAAGYFDQSHLLRDFRALAGRPAARSRQADGEMSRHFTAPERLLALLAGE